MTIVAAQAIRLCLNLLEAKVLDYTQATLTEFYGAAGEELIRLGLMVHRGHETAIGAEDDDEGRPTRVAPKGQGEELGFFSPSQGWTAVDRRALRLYRPNLDGVFKLLLGVHLRQLATGVHQLDNAGYAWEIGSARLSKGKLTSVWFARRLADPSAAESLREAAAARPSSALRLLLTSTPRSRLPALAIHNSTLVSIADVLAAHNPSIIDFDIMKTRFNGRSPSPIASNLHLSEDGTVLTINRMIEVTFRGDIQISVIRKLFAAHEKGQRVNAAKLLESTNSAAIMFNQVFRRQWPVLGQYLVSRGGLWGFEL